MALAMESAPKTALSESPSIPSASVEMSKSEPILSSS